MRCASFSAVGCALFFLAHGLFLTNARRVFRLPCVLEPNGGFFGTRFTLALAMRVLRCFGLFVWTPSSDDPFAATRLSFFGCFVHALMRPKARRRFFSMQISGPQNRSLVAFPHRILAIFVGCAATIRKSGFSFGCRWTEYPCFSRYPPESIAFEHFYLLSVLDSLFSLLLPAEVFCRLQFPYAGLPKIRNFPFRVGLGFSFAFLCRHRTRKSILSFLPVSFSCQLFFGFFLPKKVCFSSNLEIGFFGSSPADF